MDFNPIIELISKMQSEREQGNRQMNYYMNDGTPYSNPNIPEELRMQMYQMQMIEKQQRKLDDEINKHRRVKDMILSGEITDPYEIEKWKTKAQELGLPTDLGSNSTLKNMTLGAQGVTDSLTFNVIKALGGGEDWLTRMTGQGVALSDAEKNAKNIGEMIGIVAPMLATGGTSLLAKGASMIPRGAEALAGRLMPKAIAPYVADAGLGLLQSGFDPMGAVMGAGAGFVGRNMGSIMGKVKGLGGVAEETVNKVDDVASKVSSTSVADGLAKAPNVGQSLQDRPNVYQVNNEINNPSNWKKEVPDNGTFSTVPTPQNIIDEPIVTNWKRPEVPIDNIVTENPSIAVSNPTLNKQVETVGDLATGKIPTYGRISQKEAELVDQRIAMLLKESPENVNEVLTQMMKQATEHPNERTRKLAQHFLDKIQVSLKSPKEVLRLQNKFTWK